MSARDIRSAGTASQVPKYLSSGVCPRNAECGSTFVVACNGSPVFNVLVFEDVKMMECRLFNLVVCIMPERAAGVRSCRRRLTVPGSAPRR
jgi:hypothetical protein